MPRRQASVGQTLSAAYQWTILRIALVAWAKYARMQEASAWVSTRALTARLKPAFALATTTDPSIAAENPSLVGLLKVRSTIAKRGVATRLTNESKTAKGEPAYAGKVGKARQKRDEKAALAAQRASAQTPAVAVAPSVPANGAVPVPAVVSPATGPVTHG